MDNATRFVSSYNRVDARLRALGDLGPSIGFQEAVRRVADKNAIVRKYEPLLADFGRLRNAIVHRSVDEVVIAQPTDEATEAFEHVARLLDTPPTIGSALGEKRVVSLDASATLSDAVRLMSEKGYFDLPVYRGGMLAGVLGVRRIVRCIGSAAARGEDADEYLARETAGGAVREEDFGKYYAVLSPKNTIEEALRRFEANRKLSAVIVTENGGRRSRAVNLITPFDLVEINKILEDY